jgi:Protein of unknown function (DUF3987)/Primase C terminal 2 (PriCT-2)/Bifunctional DNA primase/polymerase, N-terminal
MHPSVVPMPDRASYVQTAVRFAGPTPVELRIALWRNGFSPLPCNGKAPVLKEWQNHLETNEEEIRLWDKLYPYSLNTGYQCRDAPMLDIDIPLKTAVRAIHAHMAGLLGDAMMCRVGNAPKFAIPYRTDKPFKGIDIRLIPPGGRPKDGKLPGIEFRCDKQQVIAFGRHPDTGKDYKWYPATRTSATVHRSSLPYIDEAGAHELVENLVEELVRDHGYTREKPQRQQAGEQRTKANSKANGASHGDEGVEAPADELANIIAALRFIPADSRNQNWFRVGAALHSTGWKCARELWDEWSKTCKAKFDAKGQDKAWKSFGRGYKGETITLGTLFFVAQEHGWIHPGIASEPAKAKKPDEWSNPKPLPSGLLPVKAFDFALLPGSIGPWAEDICERLQCPPDFVAIPAMVGLGAVLGRRVGIRPQRQTDWIEVANLWGAIIGRPAWMKSPAMDEAMKPLRRLEADAREANEAARKDYTHELEVFKIKQSAARKAAEKSAAKGGDAALPPLVEPEAPQGRRYIANDCTYEALGEILSNNPNGALAFRDELMSLLRTLDREDQAAARGFFLTAWGGKSGYTFDRIIRGHTHIEAACLSLLGSTQPALLTNHIRRVVAGDADDGMIQRFGLIVWPDTQPDWRNVDRWPNTEARTGAWRVFEYLNNLTPEAIGAKREEFEAIAFLRFDDAGQEVFDGWREKHEAKLRTGELHPALESHLTKYRKLVPSLALISALADGGAGAVDAKSCLRALAFAEFLESHARRIYAAGQESEAAAARAVLARIRKGDLENGFTCREVYRRQWSNLSDPEQVQAGLDLLVDCDWLAENSVKTAGKPKTTYLVNPKAKS